MWDTSKKLLTYVTATDRCPFDGSGFRVYFGQQENELVILICGGDKSSQDKDIKLAQEYWTDYEKRSKANG